MNVIRTRNPIDIVKRAVRSRYWRWRAKVADEDGEMLKAAAARADCQAMSCEIAAREWRAKAWRIEMGLE